MVVSNTNTEEIAILQKLIQSSRLLQQATQHAAAQADTLPKNVPSSTLVFPPLPDLIPHLQAVGLSQRDASQILHVFHSACKQLQTLHQTELSKMLAHSSSEHHKALEACVSGLYAKRLAVLQKDLLNHAKVRCDRLREQAKPKKPSFNHDYVPVLEKYFEYNAYPSAADRTLMARKSMMTDRQIEVWFQNHRNRSRKDGKPLARLRSSDPLPEDVSFDSLDDTMGDLLRPESERLMMEQQESEDEDSNGIEALALSLDAASSSRAGSVEGEVGAPAATEQSTQQPASNPLNPSTPPFAYPAIYVPPFRSFLDTTQTQVTSSFTFPKPTWTRHSSTAALTSTPISRRDIDAFADLFARLNVREAPKKQARRRIAPLPQSRSSPVPQPRYTSPAATCAITTILCPGRHPAFVPSVAPRVTRRVQSSPSPPPPPYESWMSSPGAGPSKPSPSITSASSTAFTFQSPPQYSQSAASASPSVNALPKASTPTPRRRKSPQLPRRVPGSPPVARPYSQTQNQTTSHPTPQRSPRPSHHPYASPSRASSSASSSSSHRVSSSSSSSASSSTPTTPNGSTMSLPTSYPTNTPKNTKPTSPVFTAQNIVDIFGDAAAFTTPSSQGFSGFGTAGFDSPDFGRMPMGNMFDFNYNTSHGPSIVQARS
ncbi:A mating type protein [Pleurotus ostreatus PC15]|uniref:A mating type protein n=1 Tax=Pleurotus ostreatus (strain PC15) TaxID=1137138 RepID=A0A067NSL2_PLEO1|nr:A mating type protein [Pleurotus ostreatus PC15]